MEFLTNPVAVVGAWLHQLLSSFLPEWLGWIWFMVKVLLLLFFYVWMRWTLPRYRYDQLMEFGWKWLLPAAGFIVIVLTASNWVDPAHAASAVAVGWAAAVVWAGKSGDPLVLLSPPALTGYLAVTVAAGGVLITRLLGSTPSWRLR